MAKKNQYKKAGREMTFPYTSGLLRKDMTLEQMRYLVTELTEEEKKSPFAELYYERFPEKTAEQEAAYTAPLSQDQMYMPCDCGKIMIEHQEDYPSLGYGCMENGVGYATIRIDQDGVTDEMIREYRDHYSIDPKHRDIFYKNWCPGKHVRHFEDGVLEDFGYGMMVLEMDWDIYSLQHAGITKEYLEEKDPNAIAFMLCGGEGFMLWAPERTQHSVMVSYTTDTGIGRKVFIHFWVGVKPGPDGTVIIEPAGTKGEVEGMMRHQYNHCVTEYSRQLKQMKEFWNQNHPDQKIE